MATPTTTTATTTTTFVSCAAESDPARPANPFGFAALYHAFLACRHGKRGSRKAQRYEMRLLDNLVDTVQSLRTQDWRPSRAVRFVVRHPKPREILAADFSDRVVHHLLVPWFERLFEPVFIHDSFANRKGKGSHAAVSRLQHFSRSNPRGSYLQLDIANFFNRINRRTLFGLLRARVERDMRRPGNDPRRADPREADRMLWLARVLLTGNPAETALFRGRYEDLVLVPPHKQLGNAPAETGLPIGNLTSQFFANVYLNELDQFVKHVLKARRYVRYVDDLVLLHDDPAQLAAWREAIAAFLGDRLGLGLRDCGRLAKISNGIDFLGYIIRPDYLLVRRRVAGHAHERLAALRRTVLESGNTLCLIPGRGDAVQATLASYYGHFRHGRANGIRQDLFRRHPWLGHLFAGPDRLPDRLRRIDRPAGVTSLASQWRYFQRRYPEHVILLQVGNRLEIHGEARRFFAGHMAARPVSRPGIGDGLSFPVGSGRRLRQELRRRRMPFCQVVEDGWLKGGMKRRVLGRLYPAVPMTPPTTSPAFRPEIHP